VRAKIQRRSRAESLKGEGDAKSSKEGKELKEENKSNKAKR